MKMWAALFGIILEMWFDTIHGLFLLYTISKSQGFQRATFLFQTRDLN
jgi:hypothetical protein